MIRVTDDGVSIDVLVQPRASRVKLGPVSGDRIKIAVTAPPVDGKANAAVVDAVAAALRVKKRDVEIASGHGSRRKTVRIRGVSAADVEAVIA